MKDAFKALFFFVVALLVIGAVVFVLNFAGTYSSKYVIENSKGYIDSRNDKASVLILQFEDANESQKEFIRIEVCNVKDDLGSNSSNLVNKFVAQEGCR